VTTVLPEPAPFDRLRDRLARAAADEGLLDVAWRDLDSAVGPLRVAATPAGVVRIAFTGPGLENSDDVLQELATHVSPRVLRAPARLDVFAGELEDYLDGRRRDFDVPVDLRLAHGFRRTVLDVMREVGYGHTVSYGRLAASAGSPRAARAVGTACATNPVPLVVPCHRIVRGDGSLGRYRGGADIKVRLLALESAA
jgi:methylated-DNA-[protein]-cysteine S-methyltransferase